MAPEPLEEFKLVEVPRCSNSAVLLRRLLIPLRYRLPIFSSQPPHLAACGAPESRSACWGMSPRIIHIPLSGGDRKAQAKGIRYAHGIHESAYRESVLIRSAAEAKIREADRLECEAWNAIMWAGGPAMPSPGDPQAEPTIGKAINGGFDLLEAKCNRCDRVSLVPLRALRQPLETPVWKLEAALYCEPCSEGRHYSRRQRAHILGLNYARPDPDERRQAGRSVAKSK
jgi:hypothetical protein